MLAEQQPVTPCPFKTIAKRSFSPAGEAAPLQNNREEKVFAAGEAVPLFKTITKRSFSPGGEAVPLQGNPVFQSDLSSSKQPTL